MSQSDKAKALIKDVEGFTAVYFTWERKTTEYSTLQRAIARAMKLGVFRERNCFACHAPLNPRELHKSYSLHHEYRKGSPNYNLLGFVHLVHPGCHGRLGPAIETAQPQKTEREKDSAGGVGEVDRTDPSKYSVEKNATEEDAREWVVEHLLKFGNPPDFRALPFIQRDNMTDAISERFDFSQIVVYRYLRRMLNPINGFLKPRKLNGLKYLGFKFDEYYELTVGEIMKMHPKRGQRFREDNP